LKQTAASALGFLLSFDAYGRASDLALAQASELRKPVRNQDGAAKHWSITLYPQSVGKASKMGFFDDTITIGSSHIRRKWLTQLLPALAAMNRSTDLLLDVTLPQYRKVFNWSRMQAKLPPATLHALRHGGASADGLTKLQDLEIADRGRWAALASVRRYRRPTAYLRRLQSLTLEQQSNAANAEKYIVKELPKLLRLS